MLHPLTHQPGIRRKTGHYHHRFAVIPGSKHALRSAFYHPALQEIAECGEIQIPEFNVHSKLGDICFFRHHGILRSCGIVGLVLERYYKMIRHINLPPCPLL